MRAHSALSFVLPMGGCLGIFVFPHVSGFLGLGETSRVSKQCVAAVWFLS